jgi:hypothetical protein
MGILSKCNNIIFAHALTWESRFDTVDPTRFRVGDIVEVQATVVAVPIRNNRFILLFDSLAPFDQKENRVLYDR